MQAPPSNNPEAQRAVNELAAEIQKRSAGKIRVEVLPAGSVVPPSQVAQALKAGTLDLGFVPIASLEQTDKGFSIYRMPFLFEDIGAVNRFQHAPEGERLLRSLSSMGLAPYSYWHESMQVIASQQPLKAPGDLKGRKVGFTPVGQFEAKAFQLTGATPVIYPFGELLEATRNGAIDSASTTPFATLQLMPTTKVVTVTNHSYYGYVLAGNGKFKGLSPDLARAVQESIQAVTPVANRRSAEEMSVSLEKYQRGGQVIRLSGAEHAAWQKELKPVWDDFRLQGGAATLDAAVAAGGTGGGGDPCALGTCRCTNRTCSKECCNK